MKIRRLLYHFFIAIISIVFSTANAQNTMNTRDYIDSFKQAAMQEMRVHGVPASITLGQGVLESASGNSRLSRECNNHFGIKCRKNWNGKFCLADDDDKDECFRGYESAIESYRDHSLFLKGSSRYAALFELSPTDYEGWANGLREAGYATNPAYGTILSNIIRKYRLTLYDSMVVLGEEYFKGSPNQPDMMSINGVPAVGAKEGESASDVAKKHKVGSWQIYRYNDLSEGDMINPGEIIFLRPKRSSGSEETHILKKGESMRDISQQYAVKMRQLYKKNKMEAGQEPAVGEVIYLKEKRASPPKLAPEKPKTNQTEAVAVINQRKKVIAENMHEVQKGETIEQIAEKYKTSVLNLVRWNDLERAEVKQGQILVLSPSMKPAETPENFVDTRETIKPKYHTVLRNETVYSIARLYNIKPDSIIAWNHLKGKSISEDQVLKLRREKGASNDSSPSKTMSEVANIHFVKPGDTLYSIATKYGISVDKLKKLNNIDKNSISIGQKLILQ
jgi:LysM repeat protein